MSLQPKEKSDMIDAAKVIEFFYENQKRILIGSASVIGGVAILIGYFNSGPNAINYAEAESAFAQWKDSPLDEKLYMSMQEAIKAVPSIGKKYEATIAQNLLNTDRMEEALVMANRSIERVKDEAPFHVTFAESSLLIEQGNFQQALENAVALKEEMGSTFGSSDKGGSLLYIHNLLRIACLQQALHNGPGEKVAWEELEDLLEANTRLSQLILGNFSSEEVDLSQYIQMRKKELS